MVNPLTSAASCSVSVTSWASGRLLKVVRSSELISSSAICRESLSLSLSVAKRRNNKLRCERGERRKKRRERGRDIKGYQ